MYKSIQWKEKQVSSLLLFMIYLKIIKQLLF